LVAPVARPEASGAKVTLIAQLLWPPSRPTQPVLRNGPVVVTPILAGMGNAFLTVMILGALRVPTLCELNTRLFGLTETAGPQRVHCEKTGTLRKASINTAIEFVVRIMNFITLTPQFV
jgi:hypothetical protein